jgi:hypothetical protein
LAKIVFIENRGKTEFWSLISKELIERGHQIEWIIQNSAFSPRQAKTGLWAHHLPYPQETRKAKSTSEEAWVAENYPHLISDRGRKYFGAGSEHYAHYTTHINDLLLKIRPDAVIGEPTLFHERIVISLCDELNILYLHPCATRYPSGRFAIMLGATQNTVGGDGSRLSHASAKTLVDCIASGAAVPSYMIAPNRNQILLQRFQQTLDHLKVWLAHIQGERYNTPPLRKKLLLERRMRAYGSRWSALSNTPRDRDKALLYAMQMQPEANIDVWGAPYSDQTALIAKMLSVAPPEFQIAVKVNPKFKYELTDDLLDLAELEPRLCLLPLDTTMKAAQESTLGTLTVTGTVGIEAAFGKGRAMSLCHPIIAELCPTLHAESVEDAVQKLISAQNHGFGNQNFGIEMLQTIHERSYPGIISEPLYDPNCCAAENIKLVANGICDVIANHIYASNKCNPTLGNI